MRTHVTEWEFIRECSVKNARVVGTIFGASIVMCMGFVGDPAPKQEGRVVLACVDLLFLCLDTK